MMMSINMVMNPFTDILPITEMYHFHLFQFVCFFVFVCLSLQIQIILTVTALQSLMPLNQLLDQKCKNKAVQDTLSSLGFLFPPTCCIYPAT